MSDALWQTFGDRCAFQYRVPSGIIDAVLMDVPPVIIEIKLTLCYSAFDQLSRYAACFDQPVARVAIAKTCPQIGLPEKASFLRRVEDIANLTPGLYILPLMLKGKSK